jgi:hypothetical protein
MTDKKPTRKQLFCQACSYVCGHLKEQDDIYALTVVKETVEQVDISILAVAKASMGEVDI